MIYVPLRDVIIYVSRRKIMRGGQRVDGFQASFQPGNIGGSTSTHKDSLIAEYVETCRQYGFRYTIEDRTSERWGRRKESK